MFASGFFVVSRNDEFKRTQKFTSATKEGFRLRSLEIGSHSRGRNHRSFSSRCLQMHELKAAMWTSVGGSWLK